MGIQKLTITKIFLLISIFSLALFLRVYNISVSPPALNWDEAAAGYNAYTIWTSGKDEWGKFLPIVFTSFRDDKHPVHIYLTAPFVGLMGNTDIAARMSAILISSLSVIAIYFLVKEMFESELAAYSSAFLLSISFYAIHFGRGLWEINFALFFFLTGLYLLFLGLRKNTLWLGFLCMGLSLYSYHSSKIVVFPVVILFLVLYFKKLLKNKKRFYIGLLVFFVFLLGMIFNPRLMGFARAKQTMFSHDVLKKTTIYKITKSDTLSSFEIALKNYPMYFSKDYLFDRGDQNPRNSVKVFGEFYYPDLVLLILGLIGLVSMKSKKSLIIISTLLLAPLPSAISSSTPNATRAIFMLGTWQIICGLGYMNLAKLLTRIKVLGRYIFVFVSLVGLIYYGISLWRFYDYLLNEYPKKDAIEWQYGMKQITQYIKGRSDITKVYMDNVRSQPYIFFAYYLKTPLNDFLAGIKYQEGETKSYNTVESYLNYQFGNWNWVESYPTYGYFYVIEPSKYSGLRNINDFEVVKLIKYPDNSDAFYIVTGYW